MLTRILEACYILKSCYFCFIIGQQETERELEIFDEVTKQLDKQTLEEREKDDDDEGKHNSHFSLIHNVLTYKI